MGGVAKQTPRACDAEVVGAVAVEVAQDELVARLSELDASFRSAAVVADVAAQQSLGAEAEVVSTIAIDVAEHWVIAGPPISEGELCSAPVASTVAAQRALGPRARLGPTVSVDVAKERCADRGAAELEHDVVRAAFMIGIAAPDAPPNSAWVGAAVSVDVPEQQLVAFTKTEPRHIELG